MQKGFYKNKDGVILYVVEIVDVPEWNANYVAYHIMGRNEVQTFNGIKEFEQHLITNNFSKQ